MSPGGAAGEADDAAGSWRAHPSKKASGRCIIPTIYHERSAAEM